jgi:TetR/AcrR family transcriptional regulator
VTDLDNTQTSRVRILTAGKMLFARLGYEGTSTSAIAREAGTSESQLVRYFGGKSGLLEAIFNESWGALNQQMSLIIPESRHSRDALVRVLTLMMAAFARDHDLAFLFLFEGRRVRGHEVILSRGFLAFYNVVHELIAAGQQDGSFRKDVPVLVLGSALLGCAEGMIRDRMIAERTGESAVYTDEAIQRMFEAMIASVSGGA